MVPLWGHREKLTSCYNHVMTLKDELRAYRTRWIEVDAVVAEERCTASIELRWQQLNTCAGYFTHPFQFLGNGDAKSLKIGYHAGQS